MAHVCLLYTVKISAYLRIFCGEFSVIILTEPVPHAFVSVNRRNKASILHGTIFRARILARPRRTPTSSQRCHDDATVYEETGPMEFEETGFVELKLYSSYG